MSQTNFLYSIYNPGNMSEKDLIENFIIRQHEFDYIFRDIERDNMEYNPQHYLIQAQRGNGKTTLLLRLYYEVKNNEKLNKWLVPIIFNEEEYGIRTLFKLWESIADYLEDMHCFDGISDEMEEIEDSDNYEEGCYLILKKYLEENNKKLILFIDNFGDMLKKFKKQEEQRFREILITDSNIRIIGASSEVLESHYKYEQPFFEFFKVQHLDGLSNEDTKNLLFMLAKKYGAEEKIKCIIEKNPGRIESLRLLTDGVPRTIVLLFEIFLDDENGNSFKDLELLLDKVTPLYKHRMDDLSPIQQEIVDIIAINWDALGVKEIAEKSKLESKSVSSQLSQLEKNKIIVKKSTSKKNNLYQLKERFFNIWYLMRFGRKREKNRVKWLVQFFELWYDKEELIHRANSHINAIKSRKITCNNALLLTDALHRVSIADASLKRELVKQTREYLEKENLNLLKELPKLEKFDAELFGEAVKLIECNKFENAIRKLLEVESKDGNVFSLLGLMYNELGRYDEAELNYKEALANGGKDVYLYLGVMCSELKRYDEAELNYKEALANGDKEAYLYLGNVYSKLGRYDEAELNYKEALANGDKEAYLYLGLIYSKLERYDEAELNYKEALANGDKEVYLYLGLMYNELGRYDEAELNYEEAIANSNKDAYFNLGTLYSELERYDEAELSYKEALANGDKDAHNNLGNLYNELGRYDEAELNYEEAIANGNKDAYFNLGTLYSKLERYDEAELNYKETLANGDKEVYLYLGLMYNELGRYDEAELNYKEALSNGDKEVYRYLGNLYGILERYDEAELNYKEALSNGDKEVYLDLGNLYSILERYDEAELNYKEALSNDNKGAYNQLAWFYFKNKIKKEEALIYSQQAFEKENSLFSNHTRVMVLLWNNEIEEAIEISNEFMSDKKAYEKYPEDIMEFLLLLLAKKQYNYVLNLFNENKFKIKDRFKPVYYALLHLMQDEYYDEYQKMGKELKETVESLVEKINQLAIDYK